MSYGYDTKGLLSTANVAHFDNYRDFSWSYEPRSPGLVASFTAPQHTVALSWESSPDVLAGRVNRGRYLDEEVISGFGYAVNAIGQRTGVTYTGSQFFVTGAVWGYDSRGR